MIFFLLATVFLMVSKAAVCKMKLVPLQTSSSKENQEKRSALGNVHETCKICVFSNVLRLLYIIQQVILNQTRQPLAKCYWQLHIDSVTNSWSLEPPVLPPPWQSLLFISPTGTGGLDVIEQWKLNRATMFRGISSWSVLLYETIPISTVPSHVGLSEVYMYIDMGWSSVFFKLNKVTLPL